MLFSLCPRQFSSCFCCTNTPSTQIWKQIPSLALLALYHWLQGTCHVNFPLLFCFQPPVALDFVQEASASKALCSSPCYAPSTKNPHILLRNILTNCSLPALLWSGPDVANHIFPFPLASTPLPSVWVRSSTRRAPVFLQMLWSYFN